MNQCLDILACSSSVCDASCCYFSYHGLINLHYENRMAKTTAAKRLARTQNSLVREAEWQLDADAYLQEQRQWLPSGLHHEFLCQQMFLHATATGWNECDHTICWGW